MDYAQVDDEGLVSYLKKKPTDEQGWEALLGRYHRLIWSRIYSRDANADDLYQEIQFAIWDGLLNRYKGKASVLSYVGGIIHNQIKGRGRIQLRESLGTEFDEIVESIPETASTPAQRVVEREAGVKLEGLCDRLNLKEQKMLILRYIGYEHKAICPLLGIRSEGASRKFLNKLVKKIPVYCQQSGIDPDQFRQGMLTLYEEGKLHEKLNQ